MTYKLLTSLQLPDIPEGLETSSESGGIRIYSRSGKLIQIDSTGVETVITPIVETDSTFIYGTSGELTRINYASGNYKLFTYDTNGNLSQLDYVIGLKTIRKVFSYSTEGNLVSIDYSVL